MPSATPPDLSAAAFRAYLARRQGGKKAKANAPAPPMKPTPERLGKEDKPRKMDSGIYRAPAPIERLRDQGKLDPTPVINDAMFRAAEKLYGHFFRAGLGGIKAQDLSRCVGAGDGGASHFPRDEDAMHHRQRFREAARIMGWHEAFPHRGAGRLVVDVVCFERSLSDAARTYTHTRRREAMLAAGMERLCEGLFALAAHWRLF